MSRREQQRRLERLETQFQFQGCDVCIDWQPCVLVTIDPDTLEEVDRSQPEVCPNCGRGIPDLLEVQIVGVDWRLP